MTGTNPWRCKECGNILGWQDGTGLSVVTEAVQRFTLPAMNEEIWVTCAQCGAVQIWRAKVEAPKRARKKRTPE